MKWSLLALVIALAIGGSGRFIAGEIPSRDISGVSIAAQQMLGGLRSIPLIRLWQRANQARAEGRYLEERAIYDLINELTPNNGAILYHQALNEGRFVASEQSTRDEAWLWVESALARLAKGRKRAVRSDEPYLAEFMLGFFVGQSFPIKFVAHIAESYDDQEMAAAAAGLESQRPTSEAFRTLLAKDWDKRGLGETLEGAEGFEALSDAEKEWLRRSEGLLAWALFHVSSAAIEIERHQSSTAVTFALSATLMAERVIDDQKTVSGLIAKRIPMIEREYQRLMAGGYDEYAGSFRRVSYKTLGLSPPSE